MADFDYAAAGRASTAARSPQRTSRGTTQALARLHRSVGNRALGKLLREVATDTDPQTDADLSVTEDDSRPTLSYGATGPDVEDAQVMLNTQFGAAIEVDGTFKSQMLTATKAFQSSNQLTPDGIIGPMTWAALEAPDVPTYSPFRNSAIQQLFNAAGTTTPDQYTALCLLDADRGGVWAHLSWDQVAADAADRVYRPTDIDQAVLGLCGPAAALEDEAENAPLTYAHEVISIYETGVAGGRKVNTRLLNNRRPKDANGVATMGMCDWMMLSAIQDVSENYGRYGGSVGDEAGLDASDEEKVLRHFDGCVQTKTYMTNTNAQVATWSAVVQQLLVTYGQDVVVVMTVDSTTLVDETKRGTLHDHDVRLEALDYTDDVVSFTYWTWGQPPTMTQFQTANFQHMVSWFTVGARRDGIDL